MPRYFLIAPAQSKPAERFDKVWHFDLANGVISIGWSTLGDVTRMTRDEISLAVAAAYADRPQQTKALVANMLWTFYHDIRPGDVVIARRGRKTLAAVGEVLEAATYTERGRNPAIDHSGFLRVRWREAPRDVQFPTVVFPMHTLWEVSEEQFRSFLGGSIPSPDVSSIDDSVEDQQAFP